LSVIASGTPDWAPRDYCTHSLLLPLLCSGENDPIFVAFSEERFIARTSYWEPLSNTSFFSSAKVAVPVAWSLPKSRKTLLRLLGRIARSSGFRDPYALTLTRAVRSAFGLRSVEKINPKTPPFS